MESRQEPVQSQKNQQGHIVTTVAPEAPEKEVPNSAPPEIMRQKQRLKLAAEAEAELAIILTQIEGYFTKQPGSLDLEALNFSLRHLFRHIDFLYRQALPELNRSPTQEAPDTNDELLQRQKVWLQLQAINRTLDRMAPICHLLSDVIECLLETLDNEELWLRTIDEAETLMLHEVKPTDKKLLISPLSREPAQPGTAQANTSEHWERAVTALMDRFLIWQEGHHNLVPFQQQFATPIPFTCDLGEMDLAFAVLLDSAGAIFGDILPNFRLVSPEDHEEISALLFDLMQQSDQMLAQFELTLLPLTQLLRHFAIVNENG